MTRTRSLGRAFALFLLGAVLPAPSWAQGTFPYLVRVYGTPKPGSGFVVALKGDVATVVTASHVIMGAQKFEVAFADAPNCRIAVDSALDLIGMELDDIHGLAAFLVRGALPSGVTALPLDTETTLSFEDEEPLVFVGFPNRTRLPRRISGRFGGRDGSRILFDRQAGEGVSGSPLIRDRKAVGLVTATDAHSSYAVNAVVIRETLRGWNVDLGGAPMGSQPSPPPPPLPPGAMPAAEGQRGQPVEADHTVLEIVDHDGTSILISDPSILYPSTWGPSRLTKGIEVRRGIEESTLLWSDVILLNIRSRQEENEAGKTVWRHTIEAIMATGSVVTVEMKEDWSMAYMGGGRAGKLIGRGELGETRVSFSEIATIKVLKYKLETPNR